MMRDTELAEQVAKVVLGWTQPVGYWDGLGGWETPTGWREQPPSLTDWHTFGLIVEALQARKLSCSITMWHLRDDGYSVTVGNHPYSMADDSNPIVALAKAAVEACKLDKEIT